MKTFGRIIKCMVLILYFVVLMYLLLYNDYYSAYFGLRPWSIPIVTFLSLLIAGSSYIKMYLQVNVLEIEFTSIVNHTFRTPLTKIAWALTALKSPANTEQKELYLQTIENSSSRVLNIVDMIAGMQDVDNKSTYFFKAISLREIIETSISKYREAINEKKFNFKIGTFNDIPMLTGDLKRITFVFDVIMENALSYTPVGGNILVGATVKRNIITFYVADSGIGLTFRDKMRMFSRFYRSSRARKMYTDGMGLGLYLAKKIMKRHNGKLYFKSKGVNKGTTFFVELPL